MLPFSFIDSMLMFFFYGFIGWIVEVIYYGVTEGRFINRGFLNGPLCPVYGLGFYGVIWAFAPLVHSVPLLFFGSATVATTVELIAGVILYQIFHLRWWDYSEYKYNLHGFICVRFYLYWGLACSLGMYILHPSCMKVISLMPEQLKFTVVACLSVITFVDIVVTVSTIWGISQTIRVMESISGGIRKASDKLGSQIYDTVDTIVTKTGPAVETTQQSYSEFRDLYNKHRAEEKKLARKHRKEERELLLSYASTGKQSIVKTKDAATEAIMHSMLVTKLSEVRILDRIHPGHKDANADIIRFMKKNMISTLGADSDFEFFDEEEIDYEDNGSV